MKCNEGAHNIAKPRPKFERKSAERFMVSYALYSPATQEYEVSKNYGPDISTLARMIEAGEL
jgi:hypothetical protein